MLGTVLDGIPESMVIGLTIFEGGAVGAAYLAAVFISNLPEAISSTRGPRQQRLARRRGSSGCGSAIAVVSGLASLAGYGLFQDRRRARVAFVLAFAAGAILTMLADTMMPEAFEDGGKLGRGRHDARLLRRVRDPRAVVTHARRDSATDVQPAQAHRQVELGERRSRITSRTPASPASASP